MHAPPVGVMVAVKVTESPGLDGFAEEVTVVVELMAKLPPVKGGTMTKPPTNKGTGGNTVKPPTKK